MLRNALLALHAYNQCNKFNIFNSGTVFNLSNEILSDSKVKVLEKGLDFAPIQRIVNEPELRQDLQTYVD